MRKTLIVAAALLMSTPAVSQAKTLEELLVEKGVITRAEAKGAGSSAASKTYWNNGTRFEFPDNGFTSSFATHIESRYTFVDNDQDFAGTRDISSFDVTRAKVILSGTALHNEFSYYLQGDFVGNSSRTLGGNTLGASSPELEDAWIAWHACDWAHIKMGQYKTFISRQFQTDDHKLQLPDRALVTEVFNTGRQSGLSTGLWSDDGAWQLNAGAFNGLSDGEGQNLGGVDNNPAGVISVRYNMGGIDAWEESDINYSDEFGLTTGAAFYYESGETAFGDAGSFDRDLMVFNADVGMKVSGFSLNGEFFYASSDFDDVSSEPEPMGFYGQVGYFLNPKKLELAARYGYLDCDDGAAGGLCSGLDSVDEANAAVNYYWWGNHLKASVGYTYFRFNPEAPGAEDYDQSRIILQVSGAF